MPRILFLSPLPSWRRTTSSRRRRFFPPCHGRAALAAEAIAVKPNLGAVGLHPHAQPLAVGQRVFLVRRLGVADFGVAQLMHDGDVPRALSETLSAWLWSAAVRFPHGTKPPRYPVRCTRPFQCTHNVPGEPGWARSVANRAKRKSRPKCFILRGLWCLGGDARTEKNGGEWSAGAQGGV